MEAQALESVPVSAWLESALVSLEMVWLEAQALESVAVSVWLESALVSLVKAYIHSLEIHDTKVQTWLSDAPDGATWQSKNLRILRIQKIASFIPRAPWPTIRYQCPDVLEDLELG